MEVFWNQDIIDLQKLLLVTRGDRGKLRQYLVQFDELIPVRISLLRKYINAEDRKMIRQTVHQVSPQLHYFGIRDIQDLIRDIETEYTTMEIGDLKRKASELIDQMEASREEISRILATYD